MPNGPIIDSRDYADILQEALARIPVHNPEWTNFNDSDPGVTLLQLFAFMTESIVYRANQIPDRNRRKFLQLLGIEPKPATAAQGFVTLSNDRGPLEVRAFSPGLDVRAGAVRFRTTQGLEVLPVEARLFYKRSLAEIADTDDDRQELETLYTQLYQDLLDDSDSTPAFYETTPMPPPTADGTLPRLDLNTTVDGCLWIALLARPNEAVAAVRSQLSGKTLTVGVMPFLEDTGVTLSPDGRSQETTPVHWEIANAEGDSPRYRPLDARSDQDILSQPGLVELTLPGTAELNIWDFTELEPGLEGTGEYPPSLANTDISDRVVTWLRLRVDKTGESRTVKAQIAWLGINATQVQQRVPVVGEVVGTGNGEPDQVFQLANTPVLPDTVTVTVGGNPWQPINDLLAADPEVPVADVRLPLYAADAARLEDDGRRTQVYTINALGVLTTGDGFHGARVPTGARVVASYDFGGGRLGNVGIGLISRSPQIPAGYTVTNPIRTWGGDDAETLEQAEKTIPLTWKHRDRLVSAQDFVDVTHRTPGVDLGRVEPLPQFVPPETPGQPGLKLPGAVTVMVIPFTPGTDTPRPDQFFLEAVANHLCPRRLVTTELHIRGPEYVDAWISVGIVVLGGYAIGPVRQAVKDALYLALSPVYGGPGNGWPLNKLVRPAELEAIVTRVEGVSYVQQLLLGATSDTSVVAVSDISLNGLQLPRLRNVAVTEGAATSLDQLRQAPTVVDGDQRFTPIPVVPEQC
jgi:hypothetical protein